VYRFNQQALREPWCRALWSALWCGKLETVKQCFSGMMESGIITDPGAKLFHCEVVFPPKCHGGAPLRIARLEPCGAPSSLKPTKVEGDNVYSLFFNGRIRRIQIHGCITALDAYRCMHMMSQSTNNLVVEPPQPDEGMLQWLQENCVTQYPDDPQLVEGVSTMVVEENDDGFKDIIFEAFGVIGPQDDNTMSSSSVCELPCDQVLSASQLLPTLGRQVVLEVPTHLTGEKIEVPNSARDDMTLFTSDLNGEHSPQISSRRRSSIQSRRLSEFDSTILPVEEEQAAAEAAAEGAEGGGGGDVSMKRESGKSLWWRLREEHLKDKARASEIHYTKRESFTYKRMNNGKLM
jgi:hypothetical protein